MSKKYYAYQLNEKTQGIVDNWPMCQEICKGTKAKYKSFLSKEEAKLWLSNGCESEMSKTNKKFYGVLFVESGATKVYYSWDICQKAIKDKKVRYRSFKSEIEAKNWLDSGAHYENKEKIKSELEEAIYFDAGTGRGIGVETRVTDKFGNSLIHEFVPNEKINDYGNYLCKEGSTNNFGELMGIYIALKISLKNKNKKIFGDSKLIIEYWSKGHAKINELPEETVELISMVKPLRLEFEGLGGTIAHISGDYNPSDLGFHR